MEKFMRFDFNVHQIVFAGHVRASYDKAIHKDRAYHGFALHLAGDKDYIFSDGTVLTVRSGDLIYLPKHSSYEVFYRETGACDCINFDLDADVVFTPFVMKMKNGSEAESCFQNAQKAWNRKNEGYITKCKAELYRLLYLITQQYFAEYMPSEKYEMIKPAVEHIHRHYLTDVPSVKALSEQCGVSVVYFRKLFKSFLGVSPIKYIRDLKMTHAKALLRSEMYSVAEVALQSGFSDVTHFSREFKKVTGVSPSEYAKR